MRRRIYYRPRPDDQRVPIDWRGVFDALVLALCVGLLIFGVVIAVMLVLSWC